MENNTRRAVSSRGSHWAKKLAKMLADFNVAPNHISLASMLFAGMSIYSFSQADHHKVFFLIVSILCVQFRLICNLMDGMVAIEYDKKTATGLLYNDVPDRVADCFIIMGSCLAIAHQPYVFHIGYIASILAILTAYIRVLGGSVGLEQKFSGPMAKQHRMAIITIAIIAEIVLELANIHFSYSPIYVALILISLGSAFTCLIRLRDISSLLGGDVQ